MASRIKKKYHFVKKKYHFRIKCKLQIYGFKLLFFQLEISVQNLPDYYGLFLCSFEVLGKTLFTKGEKSKEGIECSSPPIETLPKIPTWSGKYYFTCF